MAKDKNGYEAFVMVEKIPTVYDENGVRKVLVVSSEPLNSQKMIFTIPMKTPNVIKEISSKANLKEVAEVEFDMKQELLQFEEKMLRNTDRYKFGVIYAKKEQMEDENAIFSNCEFLLSQTFLFKHILFQKKLKRLRHLKNSFDN